MIAVDKLKTTAAAALISAVALVGCNKTESSPSNAGTPPPEKGGNGDNGAQVEKPSASSTPAKADEGQLSSSETLITSSNITPDGSIQISAEELKNIQISPEQQRKIDSAVGMAHSKYVEECFNKLFPDLESPTQIDPNNKGQLEAAFGIAIRHLKAEYHNGEQLSRDDMLQCFKSIPLHVPEVREALNKALKEGGLGGMAEMAALFINRTPEQAALMSLCGDLKGGEYPLLWALEAHYDAATVYAFHIRNTEPQSTAKG